jgi:hypothetical protein
MGSSSQWTWTDPTTWPWPVYVALAFFLANWLVPAWRWFRQRSAAGWPTTEGHIESVEVTKPEFNPFVRRGYYMAALAYSYSVGGTAYSGRYKRYLPTEADAEEFVRDLQDKPTVIHYSPSRPSSSMLLEPDIAAFLQNRPPVPASLLPSVGDSLPGWSKPLLWLFALLAAIGLLLSLWVHLGVLEGRSPPSMVWSLHIGIFVVWIPAIIVAQRLVGNVNRVDFWKVVLRGSPVWLRYMVYGFLAYAAISGFLFFGSARGSSVDPLRMFSTVWMVFYSSALAILYSAARAVSTSWR